MPKKSPAPTEAPSDQAQQIWLAGLGAFAQAQKKGTETLQKMLQDGLDMQRQAQHSAEQKIASASQKMSAMAQQLAKGQIPSAPTQAKPDWGGWSGMFEQGLAQALQRLGWVGPEQWQALELRVAALEQQLASRPAQSAGAARKPTSKTTGRTQRHG